MGNDSTRKTHYENAHVAGAFNVTFNGTFDGSVGADFFDVYYSTPRFAIETTLLFVSLFMNIFMVVLLRSKNNERKKTAYRMLFYNLSVANILCCLLSWMATNSLLLLRRYFISIIGEPYAMCRIFLGLMAAMFLSVAFGIQSCLTMFGFTAVQYRCVSRPLVQWTITRYNVAYSFLVGSWVFTILFGTIPFGIMFKMLDSEECTDEMYNKALSIVTTGATLAISIEVITSVLVIVFSALIYHKLRQYGQSFWNVRFNNQIRGQRRIFGTTLMLFTTLVIFSLPYMVLYIVTLNGNNSRIQGSVVIHYMNMLPYFKFLSDPIIYGMRMPEVKDSWLKFLVKCGLSRLKYSIDESSSQRSRPPYLHPMTSL